MIGTRDEGRGTSGEGGGIFSSLVSSPLAPMRTTPDKIRITEVEALLRFEGFDLINRRGSHDTYRRANGRVLVVVRPHGGRTTCHPTPIFPFEPIC